MPYEEIKVVIDKLHKSTKQTILNLSNGHNIISNYNFIVQNDSKSLYKFKSNQNHIDSIYQIALKVVDRHIRRTFHIRNYKVVHHASSHDFPLKSIGINTSTYLLWIKLNYGLSELQYIHQPYIKYLLNYPSSSEWGRKVVLNEVVSLDTLYLHYPKYIKHFIYYNVIYRIALIKLLRSFKQYLVQINLEFENIKDQSIKSFYDSYKNNRNDNTQYILEIDEDLGKLWMFK